MSVQAALPSSIQEVRSGVLTFVVPAPDGCNLACPFCYIRQRRESQVSPDLAPEDYSRFIKEASELHPFAAVCIQGYEPLLDSSFPYTRSILATGRWLGFQTSLISNGTNLAKWVDELAVLAPDRLSVSLDATTPASHDRQRAKAGAFDATVHGLKAAVAHLPTATEIAVTSVLIPKRRHQLDAMPALLADLGIKRWVVTALLKVGKETVGGPVGERRRIFSDLKMLQEEAARYDIEFVADDEFGKLTVCPDDKTAASLRIRRLARPSHIYRLAPNGQCSKGSDLLRELPEDAPHWQPGVVHAGDFFRALLGKRLPSPKATGFRRHLVIIQSESEDRSDL
jgi:MoaA/NifB/PqqE/SkfB family radical SAM enzyme